jgi:hypothetical protein
MIISVKEVGLAAFIKIKGGKLLSFKSQESEYVFETDKDSNDWRVEYYNSESYQHDKEVMSLRMFKTRDIIK